MKPQEVACVRCSLLAALSAIVARRSDARIVIYKPISPVGRLNSIIRQRTISLVSRRTLRLLNRVSRSARIDTHRIASRLDSCYPETDKMLRERNHAHSHMTKLNCNN